VNLADIALTSWRQHPWPPLQRADDLLPVMGAIGHRRLADRVQPMVGTVDRARFARFARVPHQSR